MFWYPPTVSGAIPTGRSGNSASYLENIQSLIVFVGIKRSKKQLNSILVLDTNKWIWALPKIHGDLPPARSYHSATPIIRFNKKGSILVIFGGNNDCQSFNGVHALDATFVLDGKGLMWSHSNVVGTPPCARSGHSATLLNNLKEILICRGWDPCLYSDNDNSNTTINNDSIYDYSFLLDTESWTWFIGPKSIIGYNGICAMNQFYSGEKRTRYKAILVSNNGKKPEIQYIFITC